MSGVAIVRALLVADPKVTAVVPAARIVSGILRQGAILPAVSVHKIYGSEENTIARNYGGRMIRHRVQVTVMAKDYPTMEKLMKAASLGPGIHTGAIVGFNVRSVIPWGENPEIPPGDDGIYEQSRDFMVTFVEAN
jgi:hypothetical protein